MARWGRHPGRAPLPPLLRSALALAEGDRVLAWSPLVGDGWAVATVVGLAAPPPRPSPPSGAPPGASSEAWAVRPWTQVRRAAWDVGSRTLAIWWVGSRRPTALQIEGDDSFLPEVVHERVQASVVLARDVDLPGGRTIWVALRKASDGRLTTQAVAPPGVRLTDPEVEPVVARARAALRDEAGTVPGVDPA